MKAYKREEISPKDRYFILSRDHFTCQYCGKTTPFVTLEIDHIVPVSKGGTNHLENLLTSCVECNRGKGDILLPQTEALLKQTKQRTLELLRILESQPENLLHENHQMKRPESLKGYLLNEPLKNRVLDPAKRHALSVWIDQNLEIKLEYILVNEFGTPIIKKIKNEAIPIPKTDERTLSLLSQSIREGELYDTLRENGIQYELYNTKKKLWFLILSGLNLEQQSVDYRIYGFWLPITEILWQLNLPNEGELK